jgi:hypothetical protein
MNHRPSICDPQRIDLFLEQKLSEAEQTDFERHLDDCDACRRRLEASAAGDEIWSGVRDSLRDDQRSPDGDAGGEETGDVPAEAVAEDCAGVQNSVLKLLAPTDDDRMLGRWGAYEVVGVIGSGGMGVVLKGFDAALNRYVAIKILAPHLGSSGAARKRFSREAQAAAAVVHDHVIEIHGVSEAAGLPYLVMPYVRGPSLQRRLDGEGPLALVEILRVGMQAAAGLAAAHAQGLVHRDVKPANILLADGVERVKLTDFGLARAADDASLTRTGVIAGTPQYMSPEQARGEPVDPRSDLFSLGSVLYAMCTGRAPFRAETSYGVLRRITDEEPRPIREINPEIPDWLGGIVGKLMAKQPEDRFQSAREVANLLEQCLAHVQRPTAVPLPTVSGTFRVPLPVVARGVPDPFPRGRKRFFPGALIMLTLIGISLFAVGVITSDPPDISGKWRGEDWGQVTLRQTAPGDYSGTYTETVAKEKGPGTIELKWSRIEQRYNGTWHEGGEDRFGDLSVRLVENEIHGALTTDAKSRINPGTPHLAEVAWTRGGTGPGAEEHNLPALHFNGQSGSYVSISNIDMNRLTFATWVKRDVTQQKQYMVMSSRNGGWGVYFSEEMPASDYRGAHNDLLWFTYRGHNCWSSDAAVADTGWHFVAVTLEDHKLHFYIDGKPAGAAAMSATLDSRGGEYWLGGVTPRDSNPGDGLRGCLAETWIFDRALASDEIARLYLKSRGPHHDVLQGLVAGYHFGEGRGTTASDFSDHGRNGTLHGGVEWVRGDGDLPGTEPKIEQVLIGMNSVTVEGRVPGGARISFYAGDRDNGWGCAFPKPTRFTATLESDKAGLNCRVVAEAGEPVLTMVGAKQFGNVVLSDGQFRFRAGQVHFERDGGQTAALGEWTPNSGKAVQIGVSLTPSPSNGSRVTADLDSPRNAERGSVPTWSALGVWNPADAANVKAPAKPWTAASVDDAIARINSALAPVLKQLDPIPPVERRDGSLSVSYHTRTYTIHRVGPKGIGVSKEVFDVVGPDTDGFMLSVNVQKRGDVNQLVTPQTVNGPYWKTDFDVTPIGNSDKQIYWALSYRPGTPENILRGLRTALGRPPSENEKSPAIGPPPPSEGKTNASHSNAMHFDGGHYAMPTQPPKFTAGDFTMSLWLKPASNWRRSPVQSQIVVARNFGYRNQKGDIVLAINRLSGQLDFTAYGETGTSHISEWIFGWDQSERFRSPIYYDRWNFVAIARSGDTYSMWVNGARACTAVSSADISDADNTNPFKIGTGSGAPPHDLDQSYLGEVDDFRVFRRCLSDDELADLHKGNGEASLLQGEGRVKVGPLVKSHLRGPTDADGLGPVPDGPAGKAAHANALHFDGGQLATPTQPPKFTAGKKAPVNDSTRSLGNGAKSAKSAVSDPAHLSSVPTYRLPEPFLCFLWGVRKEVGLTAQQEKTLGDISDYYVRSRPPGPPDKRIDEEVRRRVVAMLTREQRSACRTIIRRAALAFWTTINGAPMNNLLGVTKEQLNKYYERCQQWQDESSRRPLDDSKAVLTVDQWEKLMTRTESEYRKSHEPSAGDPPIEKDTSPPIGWWGYLRYTPIRYDSDAVFGVLPVYEPLRDSRVQWQLGMSEEQRARLRQIGRRSVIELRKLEDIIVFKTPDEFKKSKIAFQQEALGFTKEVRPEIEALFTPEQLAKLKILTLWPLAEVSLETSSVRNELGLSDVQVTALARIEEEKRARLASDFTVRSKLLLDMLTPAQYAKLDTEIDRCFEVEEEPGTDSEPSHPHAIQFDGHHYAKLDPPPKFTAGDFTISVWFNPERTGDWAFLFMRGFSYRDRQGDIGLKLNVHSGDLDFQARTADNEWLFGWDAPESSLRNSVCYGQWNHAVVTRHGDTYSMWMNGKRAGREKSSADVSDAGDTNPFIVGGMMGENGVSNMFRGSLDDFRIFRRCLSEKEISKLYGSGGEPDALAGEGRVNIGPLCAIDKADIGGKNLHNSTTAPPTAAIDRGVSLIVSRKDSISPLAGYLPQEVAEAIAKAKGVAGVSVGLVNFDTIDELGSDPVLIQGLRPGDYTFKAYKVIEGGTALTEQCRGKRQVMVGRRLANVKKLSVGDTLTISDEKYRITAIFDSDSEIENAMIIVLLEDAQRMAGKKGQISGCLVKVDPAYDNEKGTQAVKELIEGPIAEACGLKNRLAARPSGERMASARKADWGEWNDGWAVRLRPEKAGWMSNQSPEFTLDIRRREPAADNKAEKELMLNLGIMLGNGRKVFPKAVHLIVTDLAGKTRTLQLSEPGVAGRVDDFVVPVAPGASYSLRLRLADFWSPATNEFHIGLAPGDYQLRAVLESKTATHVNSDMRGIRTMNIWRGTLTSAPIAISIRSVQ